MYRIFKQAFIGLLSFNGLLASIVDAPDHMK